MKLILFLVQMMNSKICKRLSVLIIETNSSGGKIVQYKTLMNRDALSFFRSRGCRHSMISDFGNNDKIT